MPRLDAWIVGLIFLGSMAGAKEPQFVGRLEDAKLFLAKSEGWSAKDLQVHEIYLKEASPRADLEIRSQAECGTRVCAHFLFESMPGSDRYRWVGRVDGVFELLPEIKNKHFTIRAVSAIGGLDQESTESLYEFRDGAYHPVSRASQK